MKALITNSDSAKIEVELPAESFKKLLAIVQPSDVNTFFENCITDFIDKLYKDKHASNIELAKEMISNEDEDIEFGKHSELQMQWEELMESLTEYDRFVIAEKEIEETNDLREQWRSISSRPTSAYEVELLHRKMRKVLAEYRKNNSKFSK
ncbi:hypothetical protein CUN85_06240 [Methanolobus halotolerans]|uniref:Uncharacterized protein n=2 Tax=Methanolobus halotolerans TaxID=2052935 RepID=A0A4E0PZM6_9EURY|nr:hypothetical protein CUN85_06240 [Methanolobus halotolerans]